MGNSCCDNNISNTKGSKNFEKKFKLHSFKIKNIKLVK
jgi:hypothetical protein